MSKQVKLKFKKLLKKADFVQADLEYHNELLPEAKLEFAQAIGQILDSLSPEDQQIIDEHKQKSFQEMVDQLQQEGKEEEEEISGPPSESTEVRMKDEEMEDADEEEEEANGSKTKKLKKLFYKIADLTHPDKAIARGTSKPEARRLESIFRKAKEAYNDLNWYILYSIAIDLGLSVEDPTPDTLEWIEDDIRLTMGKIAEVGNLVVWVWYTGDNNRRNMAIASYLKQTFDYTWTPTLDPIDAS